MKLISITAIFALILSVAGCDFRHIVVNQPINLEDIDFIVSGKTPLAEVVNRLGAPDKISGTDDNLVFRYHFRSAKSFRINFGHVFRLWIPVSPPMTLGNSEAGIDIFLVAFDSNWLALNHEFSYRDNTKNVGFLPF